MGRCLTRVVSTALRVLGSIEKTPKRFMNQVSSIHNRSRSRETGVICMSHTNNVHTFLGVLSMSFKHDRKMKFLVTFMILCTAWGAEDDSSSKGGKTAPPFFLIDTTDQLCLAGEQFKRCSIDTLFFVVGTPGKWRRIWGVHFVSFCVAH